MTGSNFWSHRKAAVATEALEDKKQAEQAAKEAGQKALEEKSDEELLSELNLPDPNTLQAGDDFKAFLQANVPDRLKKVALRKLWSTNPVLANLDGLVEYGEDYTDAATVVEQLISSYQVGKGMSAHVEEMLRQATAEDDEEAVSEDDNGPGDAVTEAFLNDPVSTEGTIEDIAETCLDPIRNFEESPTSKLEEVNFNAARKKMRYKFSDDGGGPP